MAFLSRDYSWMPPSEPCAGTARPIVFARYGYRQTNMEVLAKEAGLSRQALYAHFPNKEAVFAAAVEALHGQALDEAGRLADKIVTRGGGLEEALLAALEARYIGLLERFAGSAHISELIDAQHRQCSGVGRGFRCAFRGDD
jgi:AcrR family transcriptional regulator